MFSFYWLGLKKIFNFGKKIFLVFFIYLAIISLFLYFINKDKPKITYDPIKKNREEIYKVINDPQLNKTTEGKIMIASYRMILCGMIGEACTNNPDDGDKNFNHSLFGFMASLLVLPYANPPASGIYWAYSGLQNAGFVPKTYAAEGIGFAAIKPLMSIWKIFRDLSYMLLVLVLISIGFMIMFRAKINPQTVISIENSIPKIVIALLLITFSFPIAGFLIDLMYVIILLIIIILSTTNIGELNSANQINLFNTYTVGGFFNLWGKIFNGFNFLSVGQGLINLLGGILSKTIYTVLSLVSAIIFYNFFHNFSSKIPETVDGIQAFTVGIGKVLSSPLGLILGIFFILILTPFILNFLISSIVALTLIFLIFRLFFILLKNYLEIILLIILSPLLLVLEAIPGKNIFATWFKNLLVNILTFPIVIAVILIGYIIMNQIDSNTNLWIPPFLYSIDSSVFSILVGLGIILIIPDIINLFRQAMGAKGLGLNIGLGTFFGSLGVAWGGTQAGIGTVSSLAQMPIIGNRLVQSEGGLGKKLKDWGIIQKPLTQQVAEILADKKKTG